MKVLILIETLAKAGAERVVVNNALELKKQGIVCEVAILFNKDDLASELENNNIKVHRLNLSYKWNFIEGIKKLKKLILLNKIDIVHSHLFFSTFHIALTKLFYNKFKNVSTFHNLAFNVYPPNTLWKKTRLKIESYLMNNYFDLNTACSEAVNIHYSKYLNLNNVKTIYNGFNLEYISNYSEDEKIDLNTFFPSIKPDFICVTPGRMTKEKGHKYLLEAIKNNTTTRNIGFLFIGSGPTSKEIKENIIDYKLDKQIVVIDTIEQKKLFSIIKKSSFVILPSISEGFPMVVGESMALGKAIISTNVSGIPELINSGENGILVNPANPNELFDAIEKLTLDVNLIKRFEDNVIKDIKKFNLTNIVRVWINEYKELLNERN